MELRAWLASALADVEKVPEPVRFASQQAIRAEFERRLAELRAASTEGRDAVVQWRDQELSSIESLPVSARIVAQDLLEKEVQKRLSAVEEEQKSSQGTAVVTAPLAAAAVAAPAELPPCLLQASACDSERELRAWRAAKLAWIRDKVPPERQNEEVVGVRSEYERRRSELLRSSAALAAAAPDEVTRVTPPPVAAATAVIAATEASAPEGSTARLASTFALCAVGLAVPALLAAPAAAWAARRGKDAQEPCYMPLKAFSGDM